MTENITVNNNEAAWNAVADIAPACKFELDNDSTARAGYEIYRDPADRFNYICDLGDHFEVNLHHGNPVNIWIKKESVPVSMDGITLDEIDNGTMTVAAESMDHAIRYAHSLLHGNWEYNANYSHAASADAYFCIDGSRALVCNDEHCIIIDLKSVPVAVNDTITRVIINYPADIADANSTEIIRLYRDTERDTIISHDELRRDYIADPALVAEYRRFDRYASACMTWEGGTLEYYNETFPGGLSLWNWEPRRISRENIGILRNSKFGNDPAVMMLRYAAMELLASEFLVYEDCQLSRDEVESNAYICDDRLYLNSGEGYALDENNRLSYLYMTKDNRVCCGVYNPDEDNYTYWLVK